MSAEDINFGTMPRESEEQEGARFERTSQELIDAGGRLMNENSDRDKRIYHTIEHPNTLQARAEKVAQVLGVSERGKKLSKIAIAWHDTIIHVDPADPENIVATIKRHRGAREGDQPSGAKGNEAESALVLEQAMRRANGEGVPVFTEKDIKTAVLAVEATYPGVDFGKDFQGARFKEYPWLGQIVEKNPHVGAIIEQLEADGIDRGGLFYQPHLEGPLERGEKIAPEILVMVLDDLGGAGMATLEEFALEGDKEFQELYTNITNPENLQRMAHGEGEKDENDREKAVGAMLNWFKSQTSFVAWQMLRIEKILCLLQQNGQIDDEKVEKLRLLFGRFKENITGSRARAQNTARQYEEIKAKEGNGAAFAHVARVMHYQI